MFDDGLNLTDDNYFPIFTEKHKNTTEVPKNKLRWRCYTFYFLQSSDASLKQTAG